jgi:FMN-dependent dehydrogenase
VHSAGEELRHHAAAAALVEQAAARARARVLPLAKPIERARASGARGLIVTLDWTFCHSRDWGSPKIPEQMHLRTAIRLLLGDNIEVLLDGGIRRGGDVVKALALGAKAVMIGRAYLWGLAAAGQPGVENVLDIMRAGIESALLWLGRASTSEISPEDVLVPPGFARALGTSPELSFRG